MINSMFVCIIKKKLKKNIIGKSVLKMADIGKMLNIGQADNRSTPSRDTLVLRNGEKS